ncbi:methyltransferase [Nocardia yamanashiensis]|uniref:methyltransferase n=1 Tax=Nocardia yamanashiensis TaxID=209247 RepID=UPI00083007AD|nr:methyltransferase [Nocardia yamanashiensis]
MTPALAAPAELDSFDLHQLDAAARFATTYDTEAVLNAMLPGLTAGERAAIVARCRFAHTAVLVFPPDPETLVAALAQRGMTAGPATPSMVVRARLATRYGRSADRLDVRIVRVALPSPDGDPRLLEIFALIGDQTEIAAAERAAGNESHLALEVESTDPVELTGLRTLLLRRGRMHADGGGYNSHENATVLYFRTTATDRPYRRLELHVAGRHSPILTAHCHASHDAPTRLLRLMTGAWATQALAVTATLGVADRLAAAPGASVAYLAELTATDPDSLARLLRYLAELDIVRPRGDGYELTDSGALLSSAAAQSLQPLAQLYGGAFYESFAHLDHAVRTGTAGFDHHFGRHHFEYFSGTPSGAELFDNAMAASAAIFGQVGELIELTGAETIVDIAGGNGTLLAALLRTAPQAKGVLLERASALITARTALEQAGCLHQCHLLEGDFTSEVPGGGDIYLLSRVLHDWDDARCRTILSRCAAAMPAHSRLYIIERLLPDTDLPSLAPAWDIHMLCNVGGRERTLAHYAELAADAGLTIGRTHTLPLDFALIEVLPDKA